MVGVGWLSFLEGAELSLGELASGSNGPEGRGLGLLVASRTFFFYLLSLPSILTDFSRPRLVFFVRYLPRSIFLSLFGVTAPLLGAALSVGRGSHGVSGDRCPCTPLTSFLLFLPLRD